MTPMATPQLLMPLHLRLWEMQNSVEVQRNSSSEHWRFSFTSVQMALKPFAPTALSAMKNLGRVMGD